MMANDDSFQDAIYDLARVIVATSGRFETKAQAIRRLTEFGIPPGKIATILAMKSSDVSSLLAKDRKKSRQPMEEERDNG